MAAVKPTQKRQKTAKPSSRPRRLLDKRPKTIPDPALIENDSDKDDEERQLEAVLFGKSFNSQGVKNVIGKEPRSLDGNTGIDYVLDSDLFFFDDPLDANTSVVAPRELENEIFQSDNSPQGSGGEITISSSILRDTDDAPLGRAHDAAPSLKTTRKGQAWVDPSDAEVKVSLASDPRLRKLRDGLAEDEVSGKQYEAKLRRQYEKILPTPGWATAAREKLHKKPKKRRRSSVSSADQPSEALHQNVEHMDVVDLLNSTGGVLSTPGDAVALPPATLSIERLRDANQVAQTEGEVKSVHFHPSPTVPVLLTAGNDRRLRLFNVDGLTNPLIQTVHTPTLPLTSAQFHPSGSSVLLTGPRPFFVVYDLQSGTTRQSPRGLWSASSTNGAGLSDNDRSMEKCKFSDDGKLVAIGGRRGYVHLLDWSSGGSGQIIGSVKMNGAVKDVAWNGNFERQELMTMSEQGEVYIWDVGSRRCLRKWKDDSAFGASVLQRGGSGQYYAIGASTGIVNIYGSGAGHAQPTSVGEKSLKALSNLTTPITSLSFDPSAQILAVASKSKKDQLRMVHLPSLTTFANWPTSGTPLGQVTAIDFSAGSEYCAIGNHRGRVLLYNLRHFGTR